MEKQIEADHEMPAKDYLVKRLREDVEVPALAKELGVVPNTLYFWLGRLGIILERNVRVVGEEA